MCKVMLVDDEKLILNGLLNIIDWDSIGLKVTETANDGQEAYEKYKKNPVDIIITDITMPKLTGLQLIEKLKNEGCENTKFIILSGYDDFSYAKKAIYLGIENYILKPIDEEELEKTLITVVNKINREKNQPILENKELETLNENICNRWVANNITDLGLEERKFALSISIYNKYYNVVSIKLNYENSNKQDTAYKIKDFIDKRIDYSNKEVFVDIENNIIVINGWNDSPEVNFEEIFTRLIYDIKTEFNISVFITIGKTIEQSKNLSKSYESAIKLQEYILIRGYGNIISFNDLKRTNDEIQDVHINFDDFEKVLLAKDVEKVNKYITKTFNDIYELKTLTPEKLKDISIKMMLTIKEAAKDLNIEGRYNDDFLRVLILEICNKKSKEELVKMLQRESEELIDKINNNNGKFSPVIKQVLCYVNDHYNEELSLKTLANKYNINTSYLGQIFSKEVGCSFSDYLNRIKNEKAKELLLNTNMKINDIAKIVGYIDTSYFYRKFKKYFGVCPSTLRNSKNY